MPTQVCITIIVLSYCQRTIGKEIIRYTQNRIHGHATTIITSLRKKISLGLDLDSSIFHEFEKKTKHKNYLFSNGIDLIYEFFNFENRINSQVISKSIKFLNNNKLLNKFIIKSADEGIII